MVINLSDWISFLENYSDCFYPILGNLLWLGTGKFIAITAVARAMIEILFYMVKRQQYYNGVNQSEVFKKLQHYGLLNLNQGA